MARSVSRALAVGLIAGLECALARIAGAADLELVPTITRVPAFFPDKWSGAYIGGDVGVDLNSSQYTYNNGLGVSENFGFRQNAVTGGGHVGIEQQMGSWVFGLEGAFDVTRIDKTLYSGIVPGGSRSLGINDVANVAGRVGYAWASFQPYLKAGWAAVNLQYSFLSPAANFTGWRNGFVLGAGLDYKLAPNWVLGTEFDYYDVGINGNGNDVFGNPVQVVLGHAEIYALVFRLSYLFR